MRASARARSRDTWPNLSAPNASAEPVPQGAGRRRWLSMSLMGIGLYLFVIHSHKAPLAQVAIGIALVGLLLDARPLRVPPLLAWFGAWLLWGLLSLVWTAYPAVVWDKWLEYSKIWLIVFTAFNAIRTPVQLVGFTITWLGIYALYPVRGTLFNIAFGISVQGRFAWNFSFANYNDLAAYTLLMLALSVGMLRIANTKWVRQAALAGVFVLPVIIFATQSRGGILGIAIFGLLLLSGERSRFRMLATGVAVAGVVALAAPESVWERILNMKNLTSVETLGEADTSAEQRYMIWQVAGQIIAAQPVQGVGLGAYPKAHGRVTSQDSRFAFARGERDTHSLYLNVLAETGVIGLAMIIGLLASVIAGYLRLERNLRSRHELLPWLRVATALRAGLIGFLVCALFGSLHKEPYLYLYLMVMTHFALLAGSKVTGAEGGPRRRELSTPGRLRPRPV